jgi:CheY-like chemotaxis protein
MLESIGHQVSSADSYERALTLARAARFDLLFLDIDLGERERGGEDLLAEIRAMYPVRAVALTAMGMPSEVAQIMSAGFDMHLLKPVLFEHLVSAIDAMHPGIVPDRTRDSSDSSSTYAP